KSTKKINKNLFFSKKSSFSSQNRGCEGEVRTRYIVRTMQNPLFFEVSCTFKPKKRKNFQKTGSRKFFKNLKKFMKEKSQSES
ncbi:hypothetical protein CO037_02745, partial [Candidatus Pacearchaeota archaeon CG_4_9_14_0_2_um_filter_30_8]